MISRETITEILSAAKIEEVIGEFVNLKRRGVNYLGLCPFHNEKTPSFNVSPVKGIFKCFGCGKAGTVVGFLMEHEHFTYPEALRFLAKKYNIGVEEEEQTAEQIQEENEKESLYRLNDFARDYFSRVLFEEEEGKAVGLTYFRERGFRDDIIRKFQLGYSPKNREAFTGYAQKEGYRPDYLVKTGLSIQKETQLTDRFHDRVIFPIHSTSGRVIGFGARIMGDDRSIAKYLNSPESDIYSKSRSLYGLYFARNDIIRKNNCYLVEGYTDVISLHQSGIENVVASSGTSLTQDQVKLIRRFTPNITILYDGDPAGIKASLRGTDMILEEGMNVRIVLFPEGEDPDSFARKHRAAEVEGFITKNAVNFILFKTRLLLEETAGDPIRKAELVREIVSTIALIPDGIARSVYIKECSATLQVPEQTLVNELNKILRKKFNKRLQEEDPSTPAIGIPEEQSLPQADYDLLSMEYQEREVLRLLLNYSNEVIVFRMRNEENEEEDVPVKVIDFIVNDLLPDEIRFENEQFQRLFDEFARCHDREYYPGKEHFIHHSDPVISHLSINLSIYPYELSGNWEKNSIFILPERERLRESIERAILSLKAKKIEKLIREAQLKLKETMTDTEMIDQMEGLVRLKGISRSIHDRLGRIVIK